MLQSTISDPRVKQCFIYTFSWGIIAHAFRFFNANFSHDSLQVAQWDHNWQISLGRFLQPMYRQLEIGRGNLSAPWLTGVIALFFVFLTTYLIVDLLRIYHKRSILGICGIMSTNLTFTLINATYIPWLDIFMLSSLLAVCGCYVQEKFRYGLIGSFLLATAMGFYQSAFSVSVALMMILMIKFILDGNTFISIIKKGMLCILHLLLGGVIYYLWLRVVLALSGIELSSSYNGISEVGNFSGIDFTSLLMDAYRYFCNFFTKQSGFNYAAVLISNYLMIGLCVILILYLAVAKRIAWDCRLPLFLVVLLLPIGFNIIWIISKGMVHELMITSFYLLYILMIWLIEYGGSLLNKEKKLHVEKFMIIVSSLCFAILLINNIVYANGAYLKKELEYQSTLSAMTRVIERMEQTDGYQIGQTPVVFVGSLNGSPLTRTKEGFGRFTSTGLSSKSAVTFTGTYERYLKFVMSYPIKWPSQSIIENMEKAPQVEKMPIFPYAGCCAMIDDILVVKLS